MNFLRAAEVIALQADLIEEFGGIHGLRDEGALESALTAPVNRAYYEKADVAACAAAYAYHLTEAHAFLDGNKRIAAHAMELFLSMNDITLPPDLTNDRLETFFLTIASGELTRDQAEEQIRAWIS